MKILITGGSGMVGKSISDEIKYSFKEHDFIFISSKEVNLYNINETIDMFENIRPDCVIHLAAYVGGLFRNLNNKKDMFEKNVSINFNIVKCCYDYNVSKLIACLSTCVFPDKTEYPINEDMLNNGPPHFSNDAYAYSKRMLEFHCKIYRENYNKNFICVIPTNIYGEYDNFNLENSHVIPGLIHNCFLSQKNNSKFVIKGTGKPLRQFIYARDLAKLILWCLFDYNENENIILSVPEEDEIDIKYVGLKISEIFKNKNETVFDETFSDGQYKKTADNSKLNRLNPDFKFTSIEKGLTNTIEWFKSNFDTLRK